ncbi:hypothetical protein Taro_055976, partial [Colocasia esculenta]|nr:hypothetical protein [Colocasia esculenta]
MFVAFAVLFFPQPSNGAERRQTGDTRFSTFGSYSLCAIAIGFQHTSGGGGGSRRWRHRRLGKKGAAAALGEGRSGAAWRGAGGLCGTLCDALDDIKNMTNYGWKQRALDEFKITKKYGLKEGRFHIICQNEDLDIYTKRAVLKASAAV